MKVQVLLIFAKMWSWTLLIFRYSIVLKKKMRAFMMGGSLELDTSSIASSLLIRYWLYAIKIWRGLI